MTTKTESYIEKTGLVETHDPEIDNPIFRQGGFDAPPQFAEIDLRIGEFLRLERERRGLTRADLAPLVGLTTQVYGRYERGEAKLNVTRLVHLSEILGFSPLALLFVAAPHLWGHSEKEVDVRSQLMGHVERLPIDKAKLLLGIVDAFLVLNPHSDGEGSR